MYIYVMVMQQRDWCYPGESCLEIRLQITAVLKNVCDIKTPTLSCKYLHSCGKMTVVVLKTCSQTLIPHPSWDEAQYFSLPVWAWPSYLTYRVWQPQMRLLRCGFHLRSLSGKASYQVMSCPTETPMCQGRRSPSPTLWKVIHSMTTSGLGRIFQAQVSYIAQDDNLTSGEALDQTTGLSCFLVSDPQELRWCLLSAAKFWGNVLCTNG